MKILTIYLCLVSVALAGSVTNNTTWTDGTTGTTKPALLITEDVTITNIVCKSDEAWGLESQLQQAWVSIGGSVTNSFETNAVIINNAISAAKAAGDIPTWLELVDAKSNIIGVYAKLKAEGCDFSGKRCATNITQQTNRRLVIP